MRRTPIVARVAALLLGASLAVVLLEATVRVLGIAAPVPAQYGDIVRDPFIVYKRQPGSTARGRSEKDEFDYEYQHNSLGFRDTEHSIEKPPGVFRIVALGDSFTYGVGADFADTYLARAERLLNERPGQHPRVEVINFGLPRHFPLLERLTLEHYGLQFAPDVVLVGFLPNDVIDTHQGLEAICTEGGFLLSCAALRWGSPGIWAYMHSAFARVLLRWWSNRLAETAPLDSGDFLRDGSPYESDWRRLEGELEHMRNAASQHGAVFVVLSIPQGGPWSLRHEYPDTRLQRWSVQHGAQFIPTLPALRAAKATTPLYWERDGHCTPAGYAVIGEALVSALTERALVP